MGSAEAWQLSDRKSKKRRDKLNKQAERGFGQTLQAAFQARSDRDHRVADSTKGRDHAHI
jgi:hypothetical protein